MSGRSFMLQGTGSDVGKSVLVAGLCRAYHRRGLRVLPFKPQNMSNNAAVTEDGGEIGRAQWLQAVAARIEPHTDMNPVLLKPESDTGAQVILNGKPYANVEAQSYQSLKASLFGGVTESFCRLKADADLVIVEGAGSAAEVNLRGNDIANMGFALPNQVPVVLVGDINRGGVIAAICGTYTLLPPEERALIKGTLINMFRGDIRLFDGGLVRIEQETGWPNWGVIPFLPCVKDLPAEDAVILEKEAREPEGRLLVAVPMLPRIANFDDLDPLRGEENVDVVFCPPGKPLPRNAHLIVLPGSKSTIADLAFFREQRWHVDLESHVRSGGAVLGICGGFQMLGHQIRDAARVESRIPEAKGLGYLDMTTDFALAKQTEKTNVEVPFFGSAASGYQIRSGQSQYGEGLVPFMKVADQYIGMKCAERPIYGTYLHGLFEDGQFRQQFLASLGAKSSTEKYAVKIDRALDQLADALEHYLDLDALLDVAR